MCMWYVCTQEHIAKYSRWKKTRKLCHHHQLIDRKFLLILQTEYNSALYIISIIVWDFDSGGMYLNQIQTLNWYMY